jgi:hypothetical protein
MTVIAPSEEPAGDEPATERGRVDGGRDHVSRWLIALSVLAVLFTAGMIGFTTVITPHAKSTIYAPQSVPLAIADAQLAAKPADGALAAAHNSAASARGSIARAPIHQTPPRPATADPTTALR